jgi:hypothetical protein
LTAHRAAQHYLTMTGPTPPGPPPKPMYSMAARRRINDVAGAAALVVFLVGLGLFLLMQGEEPRESTTTITDVREEEQAGSSPGLTETHTESTETPATEQSALSQLFASLGAAILLNLGLLVIAAFVAAAAVQRIALGEYGITVGPVAIPQLAPIPPEAAARAVEKITSTPQFVGLIGVSRGFRPLIPYPVYTKVQDPRLKFLSIRAELEERLRWLAIAAHIDSELPLDWLLRRLEERQVINTRARAGLAELLGLGDTAVAGAEVSEEALAAMEDSASSILDALGVLRHQLEAEEIAKLDAT